MGWHRRGTRGRLALQRRGVTALDGLSLVVVLVVLTIGLFGCGGSASVSPPVTARHGAAALDPAGAACLVAGRPATTPNSVPINVVRGGGAPGVIAPLCVDGKGPFPFVIDTGATQTVFDTHFLDFVHPPAATLPTLLHQPGCVTVVLHVAVSHWSVGSLALAPQSVDVIRMPGFGLPGQPFGILGSDLLSRFGAVRVDFRSHRLTVLGPEGTETAPGQLAGTVAVAPDLLPLLGPGSQTSAPVDVAATASGTSVLASVSFGDRGPYPFAIATGAGSSVTAALATQLDLPATRASAPVRSFGCTQTAPVVESGAWSMASIVLPQEPMTQSVGVLAPEGAVGLVGSEALGSYAWMVLDYRTGTLVVGSG